MDNSQRGSTVVVTGGTRGVGAGIAKAFAQAGARVVARARRPPEVPLDGVEFSPLELRDPPTVRALFPALAATLYGGGAGTVGLLTAAPAVGALIGGLFSGWVSRVHRHGLATSLAVAAWGLACAGFGLAHPLWLGLALLACAGAADTVSMIFRNTMLQAAAPDDMRGRLQGVFIVVVAGGPRLGDFESGLVAQLTTPSISATTGGLACVATLALLLARYPSFLRYDARTPTP